MRWNLARTTGATDTWQAREDGILAEIDSPRTPGATHNWRVIVGGVQVAGGSESDLFAARDRADRWAEGASGATDAQIAAAYRAGRFALADWLADA